MSPLVDRTFWLVQAMVLVLLCTLPYSLHGLPFEKTAYLNQTDGLLYVPGLGYDIPETHQFNGSTISNRHSEHELALPSCGSGAYIESICDSPGGGFVRCRNSRGNRYTQRFTCASNEFCAAFENLNGQRRDQCVNRNYFIVHLALSWDNNRRAASASTSLGDGEAGISSFMASSDLSFYVTPHSQNIQVSSTHGGAGADYGSDACPWVFNIGNGSGRHLTVDWGISAGQVVNAYLATYKTGS